MKMRNVLAATFAGFGVVAAIWALASSAPSTSAHDGSPSEPTRVAPPSKPEVPSPKVRLSARTKGSNGSNTDVVGSVDPTSKDYDPMTVLRTMRLPPAEILRREPKDLAFAGPREAALKARLSERLRRRLGVDAAVDVDCRTSSCEITVQSTGTLMDVNAATQALEIGKLASAAQVGPATNPQDPSKKGASIVLLFDSASRNSVTYDGLLRKYEANDEPPAKTP